MNILTNIAARILYVLPLTTFGLEHFANAGSVASMMLSGIPGNTSDGVGTYRCSGLNFDQEKGIPGDLTIGFYACPNCTNYPFATHK